MNGAGDVQEIARVLSLPPGMTDDEADERGWWPVLALTRDARPLVLEFNLN